MASDKQNEKRLYAVLFIVSVALIFWKLDALMAFITNAFLAALGVVGAYFSGKKWLEMD